MSHSDEDYMEEIAGIEEQEGPPPDAGEFFHGTLAAASATPVHGGVEAPWRGEYSGFLLRIRATHQNGKIFIPWNTAARAPSGCPETLTNIIQAMQRVSPAFNIKQTSVAESNRLHRWYQINQEEELTYWGVEKGVWGVDEENQRFGESNRKAEFWRGIAQPNREVTTESCFGKIWIVGNDARAEELYKDLREGFNGDGLFFSKQPIADARKFPGKDEALELAKWPRGVICWDNPSCLFAPAEDDPRKKLFSSALCNILFFDR